MTDEGHIITTNPLLARYVVKITKIWRKLGARFWIATQNLEDLPDASRRMLNMMEWWLCLVAPKDATSGALDSVEPVRPPCWSTATRGNTARAYTRRSSG